MTIHGICLVKNEADIIGYTLPESLRWCDRVYVYDNGSEDGTLERAEELARRYPQIIPFGVTRKPFTDSLRADVFNHFRAQAKPGDWWCRLDADEVYPDDVRAFLRHLPAVYHVVWSVYLQFYLTERELPRLEGEAGEPETPLSPERLARYYLGDYAEPRFFRHRTRLRWTTGAWPDHVGLVAPAMLKHKHYQYRSPAQIDRRLRTRREAAAHGYLGFAGSQEQSWREKIARSGELNFDTGTGPYFVEEEKLPRHLEAGWQRLVKRVLHGAGVWP